MQTSHLALSALSVICCSNLFAEDLKPLDPIKEPDRIAWWQLEEKLGSWPAARNVPTMREATHCRCHRRW
jgi:hypothetical protein